MLRDMFESTTPGEMVIWGFVGMVTVAVGLCGMAFLMAALS